MIEKDRLVVAFVVFLIAMSVGILYVYAQTPDKFTVTFEANPGVDHVDFIISITNNQVSNDNFPFNVLLNDTNVDISLASAKLWEWKSYEVIETDYEYCEELLHDEYNDTYYINYYLCRETNYTIEKWHWVPRNIIQHNEDGEKGEISNQFDEVTIGKGDTKRYRLRYDFGEIKTESHGYMYMQVKDTLYFDFEHSSWWDASFPYRYECESSASTGIIISCNGTSGLDGDIYWMPNTTGKIYAYCENANCSGGDKDFATEDTQINWENESTRTGNNPEKVWDDRSAVMVLHMRDEANTIYDSSGQDNDCTNDGADEVAGLFGSALDFELAETDSISSATQNGMVFTGGGPSLSLWTKAETWPTYIMMVDVRAGTDAFYLYMNLGKPVCKVYTDGVTTECLSTTTTGAGVWTHFACVHNSTHVNIYINGTLDKACAGAGTPITWDTVVDIGKWSGQAARYYDGLIDELRIYNVTLTDAEILDIYNSNDFGLGAEETDAAPSDEFYATTQISPENATFVSTNPPGDFCFNYTGTYATASCELWIGSTGYGVNTSTLNATTTCITANASVASDGTYDWLINCTNSTDYNASISWEFYVDTTPPAVAYGTDSTADGYLTYDYIFMNISATDTNLDNVSYSWMYVNGSDWNGTSGDYYWLNMSGLADGTYTFYAWANDSATNYNLSVVRNVTIDTVIPDITWLPPTPNNETYNWDGFYINVSMSETADTCYGEVNGTNYTLTDQGNDVWMRLIYGLTHENQYNFLVYCNDTAGNLNVTDMRYTILNWPLSPGPIPSSEEVYEEGIEPPVPYVPEWEWELWHVLLIVMAIVIIGVVVTR